jgi:hypothetical protein
VRTVHKHRFAYRTVFAYASLKLGREITRSGSQPTRPCYARSLKNLSHLAVGIVWGDKRADRPQTIGRQIPKCSAVRRLRTIYYCGNISHSRSNARSGSLLLFAPAGLRLRQLRRSSALDCARSGSHAYDRLCVACGAFLEPYQRTPHNRV